MSDTSASLRRKIKGAKDLQSVVRTMKSVAASSIGQYEQSVRALADYSRNVELGLGACFRNNKTLVKTHKRRAQTRRIGGVVFGSDQGLVGQFNERVAAFATQSLRALSPNIQVWAVGERVHSYLEDAELPIVGSFPVPGSVKAITPLVGQILIESENRRQQGEIDELYLFYNRTASESVFAPLSQRLLPMDETWQRTLIDMPWPHKSLPEILGVGGHTEESKTTLQALIREYLFISLFRACAESLASENACRLAAMQRADKNIDELLDNLQRTYHRLRQSSIDAELFDVIAGFKALFKEPD